MVTYIGEKGINSFHRTLQTNENRKNWEASKEVLMGPITTNNLHLYLVVIWKLESSSVRNRGIMKARVIQTTWSGQKKQFLTQHIDVLPRNNDAAMLVTAHQLLLAKIVTFRGEDNVKRMFRERRIRSIRREFHGRWHVLRMSYRTFIASYQGVSYSMSDTLANYEVFKKLMHP